MSVLIRGRNFLLGFGLIYVAFLACLLIPSVQREVFYLNSIRFPWFTDISDPSAFGFSRCRSNGLFIKDKLHAWHIQPLENLHSHKKDISQQKIVVYFHGTAGTLAVPNRMTTYRLLTALPNMHVLAMDYRGYGLSPGIPSELGLIQDGIDAVQWALEQGFMSENIILFGQSLGSAVAIATAHELANRANSPLQVGHVVSVAGFSTARDVVKTYKIAGFIPLLGPLRTYPQIQSWLIDRLRHDWNSTSRVYDLANETKIRLTFAHAKSDSEILAINSEKLFRAAVQGYQSSYEDGMRASPAARNMTVLTKQHHDGGQSYQMQEEERIYYRELAWGAHNLVQWNDDLLLRL